MFIVGAPKSGTTSLYEYLRGHPDVYMSAVKEPFYLAPDVIVGPRAGLGPEASLDDYLALFSGARDERIVGEASTNYLVSHEAPRLIGDLQPDARIVAMLRNPIEMIHALHGERVSHGVENLANLAEALAADDDRRAGRRLPDGCTSLGAVYLDTARYGEQLARWFEAFGRERVHVIVFDDFVADTPRSFRRVLEFLGIDAEYQPEGFAVHNPSHRMRGGIVKATVESRPVRFLVRRVMPRLIGQGATSQLARRFRHSRLRRSAAQRAPLALELRARLEADLREDVERLSNLLERDLVGLWLGA